MPQFKPGPLRGLAAFVCLATLLWALRGQATARTVLTFLPPARSLDKEQAGNLPLEWETPVELAEGLLQEPSATESMCTIIEKGKSEARERALKHVFSLNEDNKMTSTALNDSQLELVITDGDGPTARLYSEAAVQYLKSALEIEKASRQDNSSLQSGLIDADTRVKTLESDLMLLSGDKHDGPGSRMAFALDHYRDAVLEQRRAQTALQDWRDQVAARAPEFTVVTGPTVEIRRSSQAWTVGAMASAGLFCVLAPGLLSRSR